MRVSLPDPNLEPMVAHGSRMSWAGLLRPGDAFCPARRSRLATLTSESGPALKRFFGAWSVRYHRFTTNLSSPRVVVRPVEPGQQPGEGLQCILHWVKREDMVRTDPGGVCQGDGWPAELWKTFTSSLDSLPGRSVSEKLRSFLESDLRADIPIVAEWRDLLQPLSGRRKTADAYLGWGWIPVPETLELPSGTSACILSWSPSPFRFDSLRLALESADARLGRPDLPNQARYYLECMLAKLHGVTFGADDAIEDKWFEHDSSVVGLANPFAELENQRIADPGLGRLDRFG